MVLDYIGNCHLKLWLTQSPNPFGAAWLLLVMFHFQRMMGSDARYRYWLRYFRIPATRSPSQMKLVGYSKRKMAEFWEISSSLQRLVTGTLLAQSSFVMTGFAISYAIMMQKYRDQYGTLVFWSILIVSSLLQSARLKQLLPIVSRNPLHRFRRTSSHCKRSAYAIWQPLTFRLPICTWIARFWRNDLLASFVG